MQTIRESVQSILEEDQILFDLINGNILKEISETKNSIQLYECLDKLIIIGNNAKTFIYKKEIKKVFSEIAHSFINFRNKQFDNSYFGIDRTALLIRTTKLFSLYSPASFKEIMPSFVAIFENTIKYNNEYGAPVRCI